MNLCHFLIFGSLLLLKMHVFAEDSNYEKSFSEEANSAEGNVVTAGSLSENQDQQNNAKFEDALETVTDVTAEALSAANAIAEAGETQSASQKIQTNVEQRNLGLHYISRAILGHLARKAIWELPLNSYSPNFGNLYYGGTFPNYYPGYYGRGAPYSSQVPYNRYYPFNQAASPMPWTVNAIPPAFQTSTTTAPTTSTVHAESPHPTSSADPIQPTPPAFPEQPSDNPEEALPFTLENLQALKSAIAQGDDKLRSEILAMALDLVLLPSIPTTNPQESLLSSAAPNILHTSGLELNPTSFQQGYQAGVDYASKMSQPYKLSIWCDIDPQHPSCNNERAKF